MLAELVPPALHSSKNSTILIVEDDVDMGHRLQAFIEEETPYSAVLLKNSHDALEQLPSLHPCLLLLDASLPDMQSLELYDRLQATAERHSLPTIMLGTSVPADELQRRGIYSLRKPHDGAGVIRMITHVLASYEEQHLSSLSCAGITPVGS